MADGAEVHTLDTLVRFTMSDEVAQTIEQRFQDRASNGESLSYMDCVLFDAALERLGHEQAYYGRSDEEMAEIIKARGEIERQFYSVRTVDVTDTWRELTA